MSGHLQRRRGTGIGDHVLQVRGDAQSVNLKKSGINKKGKGAVGTEGRQRKAEGDDDPVIGFKLRVVPQCGRYCGRRT